MTSRTSFLLLVILIATFVLSAMRAEAQPSPPCLSIGKPMSPAYGTLGKPPAAEFWRDIAIERNVRCLGNLHGPMKLVIALTSRFRSATTVEHIATRAGAISATKDLPYWSATEARWRPLISDAFALQSPTSPAPRPDFSAQEVLSGQKLYFAQKDTRSTSLNIFSLRATMTSADRLVIEIINLTKVRFTFLTLFEPKTLISVHFFDRLEPNIWGYYGLSAVQSGSTDGHEKSMINRAAAFFRFLAKTSKDGN